MYPKILVWCFGTLVFALMAFAYTCHFLAYGNRTGVWGFLLYEVVLLAAIAGLCWLLAAGLVLPLRSVTAAIRRFGAGDLAVRLRSTRRDEIGDVERAFDGMAERTQVLLAAERRLLQDIAHELRSPLARLSFAAELVRELVEDAGLEAGACGCRLLLSAVHSVEMKADRELIRRAIENVCRNAIRYAPKGTGVEVAIGNSGTQVSISVRDYGPGVLDEALASIFKPFFRLDGARCISTSGAGLGLAIAERAVTAHHGRIWAENAHPGLRVRIELPVAPAEASPVREAQPARGAWIGSNLAARWAGT